MREKRFFGPLIIGLTFVSALACYHPDLVDCTVTCGANDSCPSGQRCDHGFCSAATSCHPAASGDDAARDADAEPSTDASFDTTESASADDASSEGSQDQASTGERSDEPIADVRADRSEDGPRDVAVDAAPTDADAKDAEPPADAGPDSAPPCQPLMHRFPSTPVLDDMNRTDLGANWYVPGSTSVVLDGTNVTLTGAADVGPSTYDLLFGPTFSGAQEVYVTALTFAGGYLGLKLRAQQPYCDLILVSYTSGGDIAAASCRDGFWSEFQRKHVSLRVGDVLGARIQTNDCLEVYAGGSLVYAVDASAFTPKVGDSSHIGVWASAQTGVSVVWDDFGGGAVAP